jgi:hypothetical protein
MLPSDRDDADATPDGWALAERLHLSTRPRAASGDGYCTCTIRLMPSSGWYDQEAVNASHVAC